MEKMESKNSLSPAKAIWPVHIEVRVSQGATARYDGIRNATYNYITSSFSHIYLPSTLQGWEEDPLLAQSVDRIVASESACPFPSISVKEASLQIHVYQPNDSDTFEELTGGGGSGDAEHVTAASVCELPSLGWEGLWESLIYAEDIKSRLLDYIYATVVFSDAGVDSNIVSWNRLVLLHGPPGTGKTSLCRALAQKLSIRLSSRYSSARLLEINSHSLFSRWFSESGKLVQRLFTTVNEMVDDEEAFVIVLIDEVESLTAARAGAMAGTEPSDALRVVNALLTQLDKLKRRKNVLVMATSNLPRAIDTAFVDRADIIQYVDLPPREAIYDIIRTCLQELVRKGIVSDVDIPTLTQALLYERMSTFASSSSPAPAPDDSPYPSSQPQLESHVVAPSEASPHADTSDNEWRENSKRLSSKLLALARRCSAQGMSGRTLRRLPVLAQARHVGVLSFDQETLQPKTALTGGNPSSRHMSGTPIEAWLSAMEQIVDSQAIERERLERGL